MFWKKWRKQTEENTTPKSKLKSPGDLPHQVGRHMVVVLGKDPDWVWNLKAAVKPLEEGKKSELLIRVFNPQTAHSKGIKVRNYDTLDAYPELIICEGLFDKASHKVELELKEVPKAA